MAQSTRGVRAAAVASCLSDCDWIDKPFQSNAFELLITFYFDYVLRLICPISLALKALWVNCNRLAKVLSARKVIF